MVAFPHGLHLSLQQIRQVVETCSQVRVIRVEDSLEDLDSPVIQHLRLVVLALSPSKKRKGRVVVAGA